MSEAGISESILIAGCLLFSFVLSGLESAILSMSPVRLRHAVKEGNRPAARVERLLEGNRERLLIAILLVNATVNLAAFAMITNATVNWLGNWGYLVAFIISLPFYLIWIELLPKSIFGRFPNRLLVIFLPVLWMIQIAISPVIGLLSVPAKWAVVRIFGEPPAAPGTTREEFRALTEVFEREGTLEPAETLMIRSVLDFNRLKIGEVMMPLSKVTAVPKEMPFQSVLTLARQTNFDQFPVIGGDGNLVGLIDVLELLRKEAPRGTVGDFRRDLVRTKPGEPAIGAIKRLRRSGQQLAAVYSSSGRPIGVVSVEDMIDRMVRSTA